MNAFIPVGFSIVLLLTGCSTTGEPKADCEQIQMEISARYATFRDVPWSEPTIKSYTGREYANYVLSANEECVSLEEISRAKTTLQSFE